MKKNITINLFGQLYNIDEDAYELLRSYEENMRAFFMRREDGEEVADDVEHRIAELLSQLKAEGTEAISIQHIRDIIGRIGNPEQMAGDDEAAAASGAGTPPPPPPFGAGPQTSTRVHRKLFRDSEDKMLGGVLSGFCRYFGMTDPLPWRIIFVLLFVFTFSSLAIVYLVLWALIPEARTPEDRLRMRGEPVTAASLGEEMMRAGRSATDYARQHAGGMRGCLSGLLQVFIVLVKGFAIFMLCLLALAVMVLLACLLVVMLVPAAHFAPMAVRYPELGHVLTASPAMYWWGVGLGVALLTLVGLPLVAIGRSIFSKQRSSKAVRASMVGVWVVALFASMICGGALIKLGIDTQKTLEVQFETEYRKANTHNGVFLEKESWEYLQSSGWHIGFLKGTDDDIFHTCQDPGSPDFRWMEHLSIEQEEREQPMSFEVYRTLDVQPGTYVVEGLVYTNGVGASLYASLDSTQIAVKTLSPSSPTASAEELAQISRIVGYSVAPAPAASHDDDDCVYDEGEDLKDNKWRYSWRPISFTITVPRAGLLRYGFTNEPRLSDATNVCTLFRACYVSATRVDAAAKAPADTLRKRL